MATTEELRAEYARRRAAATGSLTQLTERMSQVRLAALVCGAAFFWLVVKAAGAVVSWWAVAAVVLAGAALMVVFTALRERADRAQRRVRVYESGERRLAGELAAEVKATERPTGNVADADSGAEFAREGHLFQWDLDVIGPKSLWCLLASVRTQRGGAALAALLLDAPANAATVTQRQAAVRELAPRLDLRERVAMLGASAFVRLPADAFEEWAGETAGKSFPRWLAPLLWSLTACWLTALLCALLPHVDSVVAVRVAVLLLAAQAIVTVFFREATAEQLRSAALPAAPMALLREGLDVLRAESFTAELLRTLQTHAGADARAALRSLERTLDIVEQRNKQWFYVPALFLALGTQMAVRLQRWRHEHGAALLRWTAAWGEFDALVALGTYAAEHAEDTWPEISFEKSRDAQDGSLAVAGFGAAFFKATTLRHPLLRAGVANDVRLGGEEPAWIVSGSNMAGKSTLLRAVGANAILTMAGVPVAAASLQMPVLHLGASLAVRDSLSEGKSKFRAEVERLAAIVRLAERAPALFLVDEILSGTNSADRGVAAEAVMRSLMAANAVGMMSTHDLLLTAMDVAGVRNVHMASRSEGDPLDFDYVVKDGVNTRTNGLAIVRMLGI